MEASQPYSLRINSVMEDDSVQAIYVMNYVQRRMSGSKISSQIHRAPHMTNTARPYAGRAERSRLRLSIRCARSQPGKSPYVLN